MPELPPQFVSQGEGWLLTADDVEKGQGGDQIIEIAAWTELPAAPIA